MLPIDIGTHLRSVLNERMIKINLLAERSKIDATLITHICKGERRLTVDSAIKLEKALNISAEELLIIQIKHEVAKEKIAQNIN